MIPLRIFVAVPTAGEDPRSVAFRCAVRAAEELGAVALASRWPRAGLFAVFDGGVGAVSITHAPSLAAAVATAGDAIGVDAEAHDRPASAVHRILAPGEAERLFPEARRRGFPPEVALWCAKEAVGKALRTGLTGASQWALVATGDPTLWTLGGTVPLAVRLLRHGPWILAVAFPRSKLTQTIEIIRL